MRSFLITIDTEGDDQWSRPRSATTRNARFLPRFQALCERFGYKPTYLTNYEMARCPVFREFAADVLRRDTGEIGMHLHAWDSPPIVPLTGDDLAHHPYLYEFPERVMRAKIALLTGVLEDAFQRKMLSHRAGRWGLNETYARILVEQGYRVDCSVTPHLSWKSCTGDPNGAGGPDYSDFPEGSYFVDLADIRRAGNSPLLEVPLSVAVPRSRVVRSLHRTFAAGPRLVRGTLCRLAPRFIKLVPNGRNLRQLLRLIRIAERDQREHLEFALHSSELMPGGSPRFTDEREIEILYEHLEQLFTLASRWFAGATLHEHYLRVRRLSDTIEATAPLSASGAAMATS
jgi:hypothetical protein